MSRWGLAWLLWILAFFAIEIPALRTPGRGGTLSVQLASLFQTRTRRGKFTFAIIFAGGIGALIAHILTDIHDAITEAQ